MTQRRLRFVDLRRQPRSWVVSALRLTQPTAAQDEGSRLLGAMQLSHCSARRWRLRSASGDVDIVGITATAASVQPGWLFAPFPEPRRTEHASCRRRCQKRGAAAILLAQGIEVAVPESVVLLRATEPRQALAKMAGASYPAQPDTIVGPSPAPAQDLGGRLRAPDLRPPWPKPPRSGTIGLVKPTAASTAADHARPRTLHRTLSELKGEGVTHLSFEASLARPLTSTGWTASG